MTPDSMSSSSSPGDSTGGPVRIFAEASSREIATTSVVFSSFSDG